MRMLFTFAGGSGHAYPMLPIAHAARAAGHTVAIAGRPSALEQIAAGFTTIPIGRARTTPRDRRPLQAVDLAREEQVYRDHYADSLARTRADHAVTLCREWQPDVVVYDEANLGVAVATEALGVPHAGVVVLGAGGFARPDVIGAPLHRLRAEYGLPPDPGLTMLGRDLLFSPFPPSFRDPRHPLPAGAVALRPVGIDTPVADPVAEPPPWAAAGPIVYVTLGTVFNVESGDLFTRVLAGLRDLDVTLVVTVGPGIDPAEFGPQPTHVHIANHIPQALVLPYCAAVVSHGGSGTVVGALAHGVPQVTVAMGADQPYNAAQCVRLGVGRALDPVEATPADLRDAVATVLGEPSYRHAAGRIRTEIDGLPGPDHALDLLTGLVAAGPDRFPQAP